jgi:hypothetical protein
VNVALGGFRFGMAKQRCDLLQGEVHAPSFLAARHIGFGELLLRCHVAQVVEALVGVLDAGGLQQALELDTVAGPAFRAPVNLPLFGEDALGIEDWDLRDELLQKVQQLLSSRRPQKRVPVTKARSGGQRQGWNCQAILDAAEP